MSEAKAMFGVWHDMATAPQDGTDVLVEFDGGIISVASCEDGCWISVGDWVLQARRWMPLPGDSNNPIPDLLAACKAAVEFGRHAATCAFGYRMRKFHECDCYLSLCRAAVAKAKGGVDKS